MVRPLSRRAVVCGRCAGASLYNTEKPRPAVHQLCRPVAAAETTFALLSVTPDVLPPTRRTPDPYIYIDHNVLRGNNFCALHSLDHLGASNISFPVTLQDSRLCC